MQSVNQIYERKNFRTVWSHIPITFSESDIEVMRHPHNDPMVIRANIDRNSHRLLGNDIDRILVENGSSADIITRWCFTRTGFNKKDLRKAKNPLYGFGGNRVQALGKQDLNITIGERQGEWS